MEEAHLILSIPISLRDASDKLIWGKSEKGILSVKSAYFLDCSLHKQLTGETSNEGRGDVLWRKLWQLTSPGKTKLFIWKALNFILPTKQLLKKRKIISDELCPVCQRGVESIIHVLWSCPASMDVWGEEASPLKKWSSYYPDFNLLWEDLTNRLETHLVDQVAAIFYKIWARRNSFVFHNKFLSPLVLIQTTIDDIEVYKELHLKVPSSIENISLQNSVVQWRPPCDPFFKLNFDAAFDSEKRMMGIGIVVRDSRSKVMAVVSAPKSHVYNVFSAECYALLRGLQLCQELGMQQVIFEGDAKVVIDGVNGIKSNCSWQGQLLDDMKFLLLRHTDWKLHFVKRNGNKAAHSAAKIGMYLENEVVWIEDGPSEVLSAIFFDKQCIPILS